MSFVKDCSTFKTVSGSLSNAIFLLLFTMSQTLCMLARRPFISHCLGKLLCVPERGNNELCALKQPALLCPCLALCAQTHSKTRLQPARGCGSWGHCHRALGEMLPLEKGSSPTPLSHSLHITYVFSTSPWGKQGKAPQSPGWMGPCSCPAMGNSDIEVEMMPPPTINCPWNFNWVVTLRWNVLSSF